MKLHIVVIGMILWTTGLPGSAQNIALSGPPDVRSLTGESATVPWETTEKGSTEAPIGRYPLYQPEFIQNAGSSNSHSLTLPFRHPSELIWYIDQSEESIDMAIYDLNTEGISDITAALNRAYAGG